MGEYCPDSHETHSPPTCGWYVPVEQGLHSSAPIKRARPGTHVEHIPEESRCLCGSHS